jgi:hypothetical protein
MTWSSARTAEHHDQAAKHHRYTAEHHAGGDHDRGLVIVTLSTTFLLAIALLGIFFGCLDGYPIDRTASEPYWPGIRRGKEVVHSAWPQILVKDADNDARAGVDE